MQTNAEIAEAERLQAVPMETILPLIAKVLLANIKLFCATIYRHSNYHVSIILLSNFQYSILLHSCRRLTPTSVRGQRLVRVIC
jgi:hypothetical protein